MSAAEATEPKALLNAREMQYLVKVFVCMRTPPTWDVDYDKLATEMGLGSGKAANNGLRTTMRKMYPEWVAKPAKVAGESNGVAKNADATTPKTTPKKAAGPKKGRKKAEDDAEYDGGANGEPSKVTTPKKKSGKKSAPQSPSLKRGLDEAVENDGDGAEAADAKRAKIDTEIENYAAGEGPAEEDTSTVVEA